MWLEKACLVSHVPAELHRNLAGKGTTDKQTDFHWYGNWSNSYSIVFFVSENHLCFLFVPTGSRVAQKLKSHQTHPGKEGIW